MRLDVGVGGPPSRSAWMPVHCSNQPGRTRMRQARLSIAPAVLFALVGLAGFTTAAAADPCDECFAVINPDGSKNRHFGVEATAHSGDGLYNVRFRRALDTCFWV